MSPLTFAEDMALLQRSLAQCHDMVVRRSAVLEALRLRTGENVLEVGCRGGFYAYEAAQCVGPAGRVCAVDISVDQIAAARARSADLSWVDCEVADVVKLPYGDAAFDALYGVQVFEYVAALDGALRRSGVCCVPAGGQSSSRRTGAPSILTEATRLQRPTELSNYRIHQPACALDDEERGRL